MQIVRYVKQLERHHHYPDQFRFQFQKNRPAHWLQNMCVWIMRKLRCQANTTYTTVEHLMIGDNDRIHDAIAEQALRFEDKYNMRPKDVLIGETEFKKLRNTMNQSVDSHIMFTSHYNAPKRSKFDEGAEVRGVRVHVLPWMSGIIVLPEEFFLPPGK